MDNSMNSAAGPSTSASTSSLGVRRRVDSNADESVDSQFAPSRFKRPRVSATRFPASPGRRNSISVGVDRLPRPRPSLFDDLDDAGNTSSLYYSPSRHDHTMSSNSSFTAGSRSASPFLPVDLDSSFPASRNSLGLVRSASFSSSRGTPAPLIFSESSAKFWLRSPRTTISYTSPPSSEDDITAKQLTCSANSAVFFTRGNRVHYKNVTSNYHEDIAQLCKLSTDLGNIRCLESNKSQPETLAVGTTNGLIQLWDVQAKKLSLSWKTTREITAMAWNGPILSVGFLKGNIRHYDTRMPAAKIKEQARRSIHHEAQITSMSWSVDGSVLASGDAIGTVLCWKDGRGIPMKVGEVIRRRKKIVQSGKIADISWCPWDHKILATGDASGILRLWNVTDTPGSNALKPGKLDTVSVITGVHFSPQCKEIITTHAARIGGPLPIDPRNPKPSTENALVVHQFPSLQRVATFRFPMEKAIGDSVLDSTGTKIIYTTPSDGMINVSDVWLKRKETKEAKKELRRTTSLISITSASSAYSLIR